jgi:hypothetical protein
MPERDAVDETNVAASPGDVSPGAATRGTRTIEIAPDLMQAIRRMYPTLARTAAAVCRLHRRPRGRVRRVSITRDDS